MWCSGTLKLLEPIHKLGYIFQVEIVVLLQFANFIMAYVVFRPSEITGTNSQIRVYFSGSQLTLLGSRSQ